MRLKKTTNHFKIFSVSQSCVKFKISKTKKPKYIFATYPWSGSEPKTCEQQSVGRCQALLSRAETLDIKSLDLP